MRVVNRILIVEDCADTRSALVALLKRPEREVRAAPTGLAALDAANDFRPDVVLLDLGLPGLSGYEVARCLRQTPGLEGVVLVAVTGHGQPLDLICSREAGIDRHLVKPVVPEDLERVLME